MQNVRKRNESSENKSLKNNSPKKQEPSEKNENKNVVWRIIDFLLGRHLGPNRRQRYFTRLVIIGAVAFVVMYSSNNNTKEATFASRKESLAQRAQIFECSETYRGEISQYPGCVPEKCGRFVTDTLITTAEANGLLKVAKNGLSLGGSDGGASILDLHSGALSHGKDFVNIYSLPEVKTVFSSADFTVYKIVKTKIQHAIGHHFGVDVDKIHLAHPTFFSKMTNAKAKTVHDEYWHRHVDKDTYESFHYTSLLYLTDYNSDFHGGRFVFTADGNKEVNRTVEPRKGRVLAFTSGAENPHFVERVTKGTRYALTVSFTCDPTKAIPDPSVDKISAS